MKCCMHMAQDIFNTTLSIDAFKHLNSESCCAQSVNCCSWTVFSVDVLQQPARRRIFALKGTMWIKIWFVTCLWSIWYTRFYFFNSKFVYFTLSPEFGVMPRALVSSGWCRAAHLFINTISIALSCLLTQWALVSVCPDLASTSCAFGHFLKGQEHPKQD